MDCRTRGSSMKLCCWQPCWLLSCCLYNLWCTNMLLENKFDLMVLCQRLSASSRVIEYLTMTSECTSEFKKICMDSWKVQGPFTSERGGGGIIRPELEISRFINKSSVSPLFPSPPTPRLCQITLHTTEGTDRITPPLCWAGQKNK